MSDLAALAAYLDPGGPDEEPPWEWLHEWDQEAMTPRPRTGPPAAAVAVVDEGTVRRLEAYAAHREQGRSPAAAAWEAELQMEAG